MLPAFLFSHPGVWGQGEFADEVHERVASLFERERGGVRNYFERAGCAEPGPLTLVLSPCPRGEAASFILSVLVARHGQIGPVQIEQIERSPV